MQAFTICVGVLAGFIGASHDSPRNGWRPVPFTSVTIDDAFWSPRLERNRRVTLPHSLKLSAETGRISNFTKAAGRMKGEFEGTYFNDSDVYKMIEGAAYTLALERDPKLEAQIDQIIDDISAAQQDNGYLNSYYTLAEPDKKWTDLWVRHELYCAGHLFEAAVAYHAATGKRKLLDVAIKFADRIDEIFGPGKRIGVPGHEEIELALIKLYRATGEKRYLKLAEFFIEARGRREAKGDEVLQAHLPVREQTEIVGHAVRAMYLYAGVADLAAETGELAYLDVMNNIWRDVVGRKMYVTGGIGATSRGEAFSAAYDLPNDAAYAETCASIGMVFWNHRLAMLHGEARYADVMERALYNGVLSGVSLDGDKFFYVNPLASRGNHHRQAWYGTACCPSNIVRLLPSLGGYIYAQTDSGVVVNLYIGSTAAIQLGDTAVKLTQKTDYPLSGDVVLTVHVERPVRFDVALRVPGWCSSPKCEINGRPAADAVIEKGYLRLGREWKTGDTIQLHLPMDVQRIESAPKVAADAGRVALRRGPLIYCLEGVDHDGHVRDIALPRGAVLTARHQPDLLGGVTVLEGVGVRAKPSAWNDRLYRRVAETEPVRITAIPYYAWDHRDPGEMIVWIPEAIGLAEPRPRLTAKASYGNPNDSVASLHDGVEPAGSNDQSIPRFTWWDHLGTAEWTAYEFNESTEISRAAVYWFDDRSSGGRCRVPASWRLLFKDGPTWREVTGVTCYGTERDAFNDIQFKPIKTNGLRLEVQLQPDFSGGILEWRFDK